MHFLDLASAVEKLRWAEKEWRELEAAGEATAGGQEAGERETSEDGEAPSDDDEEALILS